jgi:ethanolamine permease
MGWSMFLECLFATIGTGLAAGGYIAFLINPDHPDRNVTTACAIACALLFFVIQYAGVKQQAVIMLWLTYAAIAALVWFWLGAAPGVSLDRVFTKPLLPSGWSGVLGAVPYALWWLVIIETVALASEEAHEPHVSIPRGLVLAQITLVALVLLTCFAAAAAPYAETGAVDYPLPLVIKKVWGTGLVSDGILGAGRRRHDCFVQRNDLMPPAASPFVGPGIRRRRWASVHPAGARHTFRWRCGPL